MIFKRGREGEYRRGVQGREVNMQILVTCMELEHSGEEA
jgi:hypothetical protein